MAVSVLISADDWRQKSLEEREVARTLHAQRFGSQAFQHAGFSVEFALKYRIMRVLGLNRWPDYKDRPDLHVHDPVKLAAIADLKTLLTAETAAGTGIGLAWMVAKDWSVQTRYDPSPFPPRRAADMMKAIGDMGLLEWLMKP